MRIPYLLPSAAPRLLQSLRVLQNAMFAPRTEADYASSMSTVAEIENAIRKLSRQDLLALRDWFSEFDAAAWDRQFEEDVAAGHLDALAEEAIQDFREGRCREL